ncbi:MAG TPA: HK97 family phage prohead protease, partial [Rhodobiaceae bacterium]|nr:HK97 family phage prohead protease [Rhodobiaceae bacterium]
ARVSAVKRDGRPTTREFERWLMQDAGFSRTEARTIVQRGFKALPVPREAG